jgi:hypothetical protein
VLASVPQAFDTEGSELGLLIDPTAETRFFEFLELLAQQQYFGRWYSGW